MNRQWKASVDVYRVAVPPSTAAKKCCRKEEVKQMLAWSCEELKEMFARKFERALDPLWVTFCKRNQITTQLERDGRRLREYTRTVSGGAPYRPYIELSLVEKKEVLQRLQLNRKNAAQNLPLMPIGK